MTSDGSDDADEAGSSTYEPSVAHRVSRGWMLQRDMGVDGVQVQCTNLHKEAELDYLTSNP